MRLGTNLFICTQGLLRLSELYSEGQRYFGIGLEYPDAISYGNRGEKVFVLQYMLSVFSAFNVFIPPLAQDGIFGDDTLNSVKAFQEYYDLPVTGVVNEETWNLMYGVLKNTYDTVLFDGRDIGISVENYPGYTLQIGSSGEDVRTLQRYINYIAAADENVDPVSVTGVYGRATRNSVMQIQEENGLLRTGNVNRATWDAVANGYKNAVSSVNTAKTQYPGYVLKINDTD